MQTEILKVTGMTCGGCVSKITDALEAVAGVDDVNVSLSAGEATVQFDEHLASIKQLNLAVQGAGYGIGTANTAQKQPVKGGCCG